MILSDLPLTDDHLGEIITRLKTLPHPFEPLPETPATAVTSRSFHKSATPIQDQSYMISQGCYGLSQDKPIGTQHVGNCVAIILRNPQTNLTSLIHFDAHTDPKSLDKVFQAFEGQPIEAAIIGAKYAETTDQKFKGYYQDTSRTNLLNVLSILAARNVNLTSAWVADINQPHAFIITPKSGQMEVGAPSISDPEQNILFATRYFSSNNQAIALAYDLTHSTERALMPLDTETIDFFNRFEEATRTKNKEGLDEWMIANKRNPDDLPFFTSMLKHYQASQTTDQSAQGITTEQTAAISLIPH
ncbi:MAG TPA: hypothetical protein DCM27_02055 [Rhodospirillaceae bacterium]|nr:hypothetical protein [Rhodospirillaceae bacterium]